MGDAPPDKKAQHRLSDRVYWKTEAKPGEQIQDRRGGVLLVTATGECYPIALAEPTPLTTETALSHADRATHADHPAADRLTPPPALLQPTPRRPHQPPSRPPDPPLHDEPPPAGARLANGSELR